MADTEPREDRFEEVDPGWVTATDAMDSVLASGLSDSEKHELATEILHRLEVQP